jgi:PHS family inorganic phosphate transporter-like MFS transporter
MDIERNVKQACRNIATVLSANGIAPGVWRLDPEASTERTDSPRASIRDFKLYFGRWENARILLGTAYSWFALDVRTPLQCKSMRRRYLTMTSRTDRVLWARPQLV